MDVKCPYCGNRAYAVKGEEIYRGFTPTRDRKFYMCRPCNAWVGTHRNSGKPLGTLANQPLRALRSRVHELFDPLWKNGGMSRSRAYSWLAKKMGIPKNKCHTAYFGPVQCKQAIKILKEL